MPLISLTPQEIVAELDKHIVGQAAAKRAVAIAVRNRWRRQQLPQALATAVIPKNILMIGPTGVGKTEIARRLANLTGAPFIKVEATKYTEVGYVGRDVESMVRDLVEIAIRMVQQEQAAALREKAAAGAEERLIDMLLPLEEQGRGGGGDPETQERLKRSREKMRGQLRAGMFDAAAVEVSVTEKPQTGNLLGMMGMDQMDAMGGGGLSEMFERLMPGKTQRRRLRVPEAREFFMQQEAEKLIDRESVVQQAIERVENSGIIFIDEIDKIAGAESKSGPDVSRGGVQRDLLPIVEGSTVTTKHGPVRTDHVLFIAAGAFHQAKPSDLMPELQGRFPIRVELSDLTKDDLTRILTEPENSLMKQTVSLLSTEEVTVEFTEDAVEAIAEFAYNVNRKQQNIGARRLNSIVEKVCEELSFSASERRGQRHVINGRTVKERLTKITAEEDRSKYLL
ncbi:MAG: ATP-dependent protease ATPase subunit HslU [Phycisphaerales bacterium]|nr:ATP-dependent protease ATPase subunit HslU [Phycisphaerales bacterium]